VRTLPALRRGDDDRGDRQALLCGDAGAIEPGHSGRQDARNRHDAPRTRAADLRPRDAVRAEDGRRVGFRPRGLGEEADVRWSIRASALPPSPNSTLGISSAEFIQTGPRDCRTVRVDVVLKARVKSHRHEVATKPNHFSLHLA